MVNLLSLTRVGLPTNFSLRLALDFGSAALKGVTSIDFGRYPLADPTQLGFYIVDSKVEIDTSTLGRPVYRLEARESHKTLETVSQIADWMANHGANKESRLICVGEGLLKISQPCWPLSTCAELPGF